MCDKDVSKCGGITKKRAGKRKAGQAVDFSDMFATNNDVTDDS